MNKYFKNFLIKLGWQDCPICNEFIKPKFVQDWVYHPEEPPMFYHYECPKCNIRTDIKAAKLTENAVKKLGYKDFEEYYNKVILKGE